MDNPHPEPETDGVNVALEKIRALESRIRQAIQMNNRDLDRPVDVVERERSALDSVEIQLELVEDKLRELRLLTLDPREYDDRTVTMSQLDRVRQELLATARSELRHVTSGKEIVREVIAFADVHEGTTPREDPLVSSSEASPHLQLPDLSPEGEAWTLKSADWRTPPKSAPAQEPGAAQQQPLHVPAALQDPYGWDAFKEAPSQAAARRESLDRWDRPRPYTEDAVDRMLSTSGARGTGREQRAKTCSAVSKELFSPTAMMDDDSYVQADSSSRYQHDPQFGGKISLSGYQGAKSDSPSSPQPLPPMPPDHPRVRELIGSEAVARAGQEEQTPSSAASAQSWCVGPAVPRSRYIDPPTPLQEPEQAPPPRSPGALDGFRRGVARTLAAAPQCIMAGAIVAAGAAGFLKATEGVVLGKPEQAKPRVRSRAKENCPAPPFYNTSPTGTPPRGRLYPDLPPEMPACRG